MPVLESANGWGRPLLVSAMVLALAIVGSFSPEVASRFRSLTTANLPLPVKQWAASGRHVLLDVSGHTRLIWLSDLRPGMGNDHSDNATAMGGQGSILVCLHGFPTSSYDWHLVLPDLTRHFDRVILFDFLGFGLSEKPTDHAYSIMEQTDITEALLSQLGVGEVHILAHDYGVSVAQELIARHMERAKGGDDRLEIRSTCFLNGGIIPDAHRPRLVQTVLAEPHIGPFLAYFTNYWLFSKAMREVFGELTAPSKETLEELWSLIAYEGGHRLISSLLGYMGDRQRNHGRWVNALKEVHRQSFIKKRGSLIDSLCCKTTIRLHLIDGPADPVSGRHLAERYIESCVQFSS